MGVIYLKPLDDAMAKLQNHILYFRYVDDWVILAPTRWKFRKAIKKMNEVLEKLKLKLHPDKTQIGKIENGFDFLGYHITPEKLIPAKKTINNFFEKISRLKEQGADSKSIWDYIKRWLAWVRSGIRGECEAKLRVWLKNLERKINWTKCPLVDKRMGRDRCPSLSS